MMVLNKTKKLVLSAMFLAIAMVLPSLFGGAQPILQRISPMHLPVMLCGFACGWPYGLAVGIISPLLRGTLFGVPPLVPTGLSMACELATYGFVTGFLYQFFSKKKYMLYVELLIAMLAGRIVMGLVDIPLYGMAGKEYSLKIFLTMAFVNAVPALIFQIIVVPLLVMAFRKARFMD